MVKFNKFIFALFLILLFLLVSFHSVNSDNSNNNQIVAHGFKLIESFYKYLLSDRLPEKNTNLFHGIYSSSPERNLLQEEIFLWKYFRDNQSLFLTDRYKSGKYYNEKDFYSKSKKMISYFNPPKGKPVTDGLLYITLVSTTAKSGSDGVYKEIAFPIVLDEDTNSYKIEWISIKVNGVHIDPYSSFKRNFELFKRLGFK